MALRLRRGTDAERLLVTPLEGELIYTTDTKILYIGDGTTVGGLQVTGAFPESINDLNDVDISTVAPEVGQVLKWNGLDFSPADLVDFGQQIKADIIADDSTLLVDSETQNFQGNIFTGNTFVGNLFNGTFVGDGSGLTNLPVSADGSGVVEGSNYRINIAADDSTIMVDTNTLTFRGNLVGNVTGNVTGDVNGSVRSNAGVLLVDAVSSEVVGDTNNKFSITDFAQANFMRLEGVSAATGQNPGIQINTESTINDGSNGDAFTIVTSHENVDDAVATVVLRTRGTNDAPTTVQQGDIIAFNGYASLTDGGVAITSRWDYIIDGPVSPGIAPGTVKLSTQADVGDFNTIDVLDYTGATNLIRVTAQSFTGDLKGSVFADDSSILVDAVNGIIPGYISVESLKTIVASSIDFSDFQTKIAAL